MVNIKKLTIGELNILTRLFRYNDVNAMLRENTEMINTEKADIFCIFIDNEPIGELHVKYTADDELYAVNGIRAYLYAFRINKQFRGKGYGKKLMQAVIETLEKEGYREFTIGVGDENIRAKHIYESFGFTTVIARKYESYQGGEYSYSLYLKS